MYVTLRNAIHFHLHPVSTHAHDAGEPQPWLYRSSKARDGTSAGNDMDREPGTGDGKPGTRDGEPEPGTRDQGAPGIVDGRTRDGTSAGNDMDREPGTGDGKPGTRDGAVQCTCVHVRLLNLL